MYNNQEWIDRLSGKLGQDAQHQVLTSLHKHLHGVAYGKLRRLRVGQVGLKNLSDTELSELAEDFAQDTVEKLMRNNARLLSQFRHEGSFKGWTAKILLRLVASELRRPYWARRNEMNEEKFGQLQDLALRPENELLITEVYGELKDCLARLNERRRHAFVRCKLERASAEEVAAELQTTANAVNIMNHRTGKWLSKCMEQKGFGKDTLGIFDQD